MAKKSYLGLESESNGILFEESYKLQNPRCKHCKFIGKWKKVF